MLKPRWDDAAQVHIIEMLTLFWLFFMTAAFVINVHVPDANSVIVDASLSMAGRDALDLAASETAVDAVNHSSRLTELLEAGQDSSACDLIRDGLSPTFESNCWVASDGGMQRTVGTKGSPIGHSRTSYVIVQDSGTVWHVGLDVWSRGGGAA